MSNNQFIEKAKYTVLDYYINNGLIKKISLDQIYIVWFCKTLQNWKALVSTDISDGRYYEVTYNGDRGETYLDVYEKQENVCIRDEVVRS